MNVFMQCEVAVKEIYAKFDASHDFMHIERVMQNAKVILQTEPTANARIVQLAVLLHDVSDAKYVETKKAEQLILESLPISQNEKSHITQIIEQISFRGGNEIEATSIEAQIVQDADRLDAIGAIGIARAFTYGGAKGRPLYDENEQARTTMSEEAYRMNETATVTHFYEKLLQLKNLMKTAKGKQLAAQRHQFMEQFLQQLQNEREGIQ